MISAEFFSRADCPLCEKWWQQIDDWPLKVEYRDIDSEPSLQARYRWRVPVLRLGEGAEFDLAVEGEADRCLVELAST